MYNLHPTPDNRAIATDRAPVSYADVDHTRAHINTPQSSKHEPKKGLVFFNSRLKTDLTIDRTETSSCSYKTNSSRSDNNLTQNRTIPLRKRCSRIKQQVCTQPDIRNYFFKDEIKTNPVSTEVINEQNLIPIPIKNSSTYKSAGVRQDYNSRVENRESPVTVIKKSSTTLKSVGTVAEGANGYDENFSSTLSVATGTFIVPITHDDECDIQLSDQVAPPATHSTGTGGTICTSSKGNDYAVTDGYTSDKAVDVNTIHLHVYKKDQNVDFDYMSMNRFYEVAKNTGTNMYLNDFRVNSFSLVKL